MKLLLSLHAILATLPKEMTQPHPLLFSQPQPTSCNQAIKALSCSALENQMYLVVDVSEKTPCDNSTSCPPSGSVLHNTQVVFDRNGTVIAR